MNYYNYTEIEPKEFKVYHCFPKPVSGEYSCVLIDGEARKYKGISFEVVEVVLKFKIEDEYGMEYLAEKVFLYSEQEKTKYFLFMREIEWYLGFSPVYLFDIIGLKGHARVEVMNNNGELKIEVMEFFPDGYDQELISGN
ncbi:hypothetical protein GH811_02675 [Acetobacterium malicum]|uniref:Uncharacterized protein n=1 Tax=Acetobacterium malicum TaxID=52692 RepID=A0ABR6YTS3_9FIRM|nr:hypothetical protein [Acetobacterium malicum]MBC3898521.1 hypothetical protein [Acetobacterium malicum]